MSLADRKEWGYCISFGSGVIFAPTRRARRISVFAAFFASLLALAVVCSASSGIAQTPHEAAGSATSILNYDKKGNFVDSQSDKRKDAGQPNSQLRRNGAGTPRSPGTGEAGTGSARRALPPSRARPVRGHVDGEILAVDLGPAGLQRAQSLGFALLDSVALDALGVSLLRFRAPTSATTRDALDLFRRAFPRTDADFNAWMGPSIVPSLHEGVRAVGWRRVSNACGAGLRIGMIDTPVDIDHLALKDRRIERKRFVPGRNREASASHGTAIAALLVGNPETHGLGGLLPGASLMAASIFERAENNRAIGNLFAFLQALNWMAEQKVQVLNMSLETGENLILSIGLGRAGRHGMIMTAAAGNGGAKAKPAYPAAHPDVLAVTAVSTRLRPFNRANRGPYIDFSAPGVRLWTAAVGGGGRYQSGTSLAVPFVTAVVALQVASGLDPNLRAIRNALISNVQDLGIPGKDEVYGWGFIRFHPACSDQG